jgi:zinc/manganese transport system permease protein
MGWLFEPGFFSSPEVHTALVIGGISAVVSALVGVFTVIRGQSFAGHALTDVSAAGGSGALLIGVNPLAGFIVGSLAGAGAMEAVGVRHVRGRDVATGIVLGASIGVASLFLYLTTSTTATTGATQQILFGSIFVTTPSTVPVVALFSVISLGLLATIYRPLLLTSVNDDLAAAKGIPVRLVGMAYMAALALAVGLSSLAIGAILSTALLIGPPATALRLTKRISRSLVAAAAIGLTTTWLGILLAYDSGAWASGRDSLPVSFCIVGLVFVAYLATEVTSRVSSASRRVGTAEPVPEAYPRLAPEEGACSRGS